MKYVEYIRAAAGALIGLFITGLVSEFALGPSGDLPLFIAPMGASSVLLFAVPASPFAQPRAIIAGNFIAATVGVACGLLIRDPLAACAVAAALSVALMLAFRCVHPPSGAVALTAILGGTAIRDAGFWFVLWPVGVNTLLLVGAAFLFNNLTGRRYPHRLEAAGAARPLTGEARTPNVEFGKGDIEEALKLYGELLDVAPGDLETVLRETQHQALRRRLSTVRCADIMTRNVVAVAPGDTIAHARDLLRREKIRALPVTDDNAVVVGFLTQTDLVQKTDGDRIRSSKRLGKMFRLGTAAQPLVEEVMERNVRAARPDMSIAELVAAMAHGGLHHLPVVGPEGRLLGIITQTDVIAALLRDGGPNPLN